VLKLAKTGSLDNRRSPALRRAWEEHGRTDLFPALLKVRRVRDSELSGAEVRRRPLWRYALVWRKTAS